MQPDVMRGMEGEYRDTLAWHTRYLIFIELPDTVFEYRCHGSRIDGLIIITTLP